MNHAVDILAFAERIDFLQKAGRNPHPKIQPVFKQLLNQANCEVAKQLPIDTKFNLLSVKSQISPESVCKEILDFYNGDIPEF